MSTSINDLPSSTGTKLSDAIKKEPTIAYVEKTPFLCFISAQDMIIYYHPNEEEMLDRWNAFSDAEKRPYEERAYHPADGSRMLMLVKLKPVANDVASTSSISNAGPIAKGHSSGLTPELYNQFQMAYGRQRQSGYYEKYVPEKDSDQIYSTTGSPKANNFACSEWSLQESAVPVIDSTPVLWDDVGYQADLSEQEAPLCCVCAASPTAKHIDNQASA